MDRLGKTVAVFAGVSVGIPVLLFFAACIWIGYEVRNICYSAIQRYGNDCTLALSTQLEDGRNGYRERNDAIWALGQLGDARALPVLRKHYTGAMPAREPLDKTISQYELRKAINLTSGGINISAFVWRGPFPVR